LYEARLPWILRNLSAVPLEQPADAGFVNAKEQGHF
jgi:hypothetical protein